VLRPGKPENTNQHVFDPLRTLQHFPALLKPVTGPPPNFNGTSFMVLTEAEIGSKRAGETADAMVKGKSCKGGKRGYIAYEALLLKGLINQQSLISELSTSMMKTSDILRKGHQTHNFYEERSSTALIALENYKRVLKENGIVIAAATMMGMFEATLKILNLKTVKVKDKDLTQEEFRVRAFTWTCAGK
jgi:hypothetical protein